jgi:hypothetical protein
MLRACQWQQPATTDRHTLVVCGRLASQSPRVAPSVCRRIHLHSGPPIRGDDAWGGRPDRLFRRQRTGGGLRRITLGGLSNGSQVHVAGRWLSLVSTLQLALFPKDANTERCSNHIGWVRVGRMSNNDAADVPSGHPTALGCCPEGRERRAALRESKGHGLRTDVCEGGVFPPATIWLELLS